MPTIAHELKISAPTTAVYWALTDVAEIQNWCAKSVTHSSGASAAKEGDTIDMHFGPNKDFRWEFIHLVPGRHVGWKCVAGPDDAPGTGVAFEIADAGNGRTTLSLEHKGWTEGHPEFVRCNTRWGALLGQLKHYLEQGQTQKAIA